MKEGQKITIADIAEELGVSKTTVSRAISGKGRIGEETRRRVQEYIEKYNYKPNLVAQGLAKSKTFNIGITMPGKYELMDLPFFENCLIGIYEVASQLGYDILLNFNDNTSTTYLERIVNHHKVDGVILLRSYTEDKAIRFLKERNIPFVVIGSTTEPNVYQIDHDHREACKELISILLMKEMKSIALIGGDEDLVVNANRKKGFMEAHEKLGVAVDNSHIYMNCDSSQFIEKALDNILDSKVDCIACMDDSICSIVLKELRKRKVKVPKDIRIVSFYDSMVLENNDPSVTSLSFESRELGMQATKNLVDLMDEKDIEKRCLMGYEVVLKESTK